MRRTEVGCLVIALLLGAEVALAQDAELPSIPPPPPGYVAPAPAAAPAASAAPATGATGATGATPATEATAQGMPPAATPEPSCVPTCRSGYVCVQGQCVTACNPPCSASQTCTPDRQCLATPPLFALPPQAHEHKPPDPTAARHDGFMARATIGLGGASVKSKPVGSDTTVRDFSGGVLALSLDVGGTPTDNFVIHGRFAGMSVPSPRARIGDLNQPRSDQNSAGVLLLAPAVTYYFMPINIYATGAVGLSWLFEGYRDALGNDHSYRTPAGLGLNVDLGKEWWVNDQWGFGVTGRFWYTHISADNRDTVAAFALLFSATYQ